MRRYTATRPYPEMERWLTDMCGLQDPVAQNDSIGSGLRNSTLVVVYRGESGRPTVLAEYPLAAQQAMQQPLLL